MEKKYSTTRLHLDALAMTDAAFIMELVNTPGWLQFIGDRNVHSIADAEAYMQRIMNTATVRFWVIRTKEENNPIGIISFIQREYLDHPDIGFALLQDQMGKGYAKEAAGAVLENVFATGAHSTVLATTLPSNQNSIALLQSMGFTFIKEIMEAGELLRVYRIIKY